jgi:malonate-semialdehyde dehydrogenase (acetylating)/methylmalonate-semialdehyde dehydrogenase
VLPSGLIAWWQAEGNLLDSAGAHHGNGASIFTRSGKAAREFKHRIQCGMVGINIGVPASMAWFPFNGWNDSFFGDLHMQGREGVQFFTQLKVTTSRWFSYGEGDIWHREPHK